MGANQDQIESFIANLANSPEPEKLIDVANQVAQLSRSESIPLEELEGHVKQKEEEKQRLEEEIKQSTRDFRKHKCRYTNDKRVQAIKGGIKQASSLLEDPERLVTGT